MTSNTAPFPANAASPALAEPAVYWVTGLSGAGKTTLAGELDHRLRARGRSVILLDGDDLRKIFGGGYGFGRDDRLRLATSYGRLCKTLAEQGMDVVCATISMFDACRDWNRENIPGYVEIYLQADVDWLIEQDTKGLYARALSGEEKNVYGVDLDFEEPKNPHVTIHREQGETPAQSADRVFDFSHGAG